MRATDRVSELQSELDSAKATIAHMSEAMSWIAGHDRQGLDHLQEALDASAERDAAEKKLRQITGGGRVGYMSCVVAACWTATVLVGVPIAVFAHQYAPLLGMSIGALFYTAMWGHLVVRTELLVSNPARRGTSGPPPPPQQD